MGISRITAIMDAIAEQLEDNLTVPAGLDLHIEARAFLAAEMPAIDMLIANPTGLEAGLAGFGQSMGGIPITIRARVSTTDVMSGEDLLLEFMDQDGDLSILAALDADQTLGGVIDSMKWTDGFPWAGYVDFPTPDGNGVLLGSTLTVVCVPSVS